MDTWITIWTVCFFTSIALFAVMAIWVGIGGWKDLMTMFAELKKQNSEASSDSSDNSKSS